MTTATMKKPQTQIKNTPAKPVRPTIPYNPRVARQIAENMWKTSPDLVLQMLAAAGQPISQPQGKEG